MPKVKYFGIPPNTDEESCLKFKAAVKEVIAAIPEMKLTTKDISVKLIGEVGGDDGDIQIEVSFNDKEDRTTEVRNKVADALTKATAEYFPDLTLTECWGEPFDHNRGFSIIRKE